MIDDRKTSKMVLHFYVIEHIRRGDQKVDLEVYPLHYFHMEIGDSIYP